MNWANATKTIGVDNIPISELNMKIIKQKYHKLSLLHHPDKNNNTEKAKIKFQEITKNDGPMEVLDQDTVKVCLKKNEIFLFYPNKIYHRATSPNSGQRFQMMFQLIPSKEWKLNCNIFQKQKYREPKFPFFSYLFDKKKILSKND